MPALIETILFGIIQGVTEFLPVSSSGHLVLFELLLRKFSLPGIEGSLPFFVFLHGATLLAVLLFVWRRLSLFLQWKFFLKIFFITLLSAVMGLMLKYFFISLFLNKYFLGVAFFCNAIALLSIGKTAERKASPDLSFADIVLLGVFQGLALLPGISRSGITIAILLHRGYKKEEAFIISFLMAVPAILGAFVWELRGMQSVSLSPGPLSLGFVVALAAGLLSLFFLKKILLLNRFRNFGYYCLPLSLVAFLL